MRLRIWVLALLVRATCLAQSSTPGRQAAEYYAAAYARHYGLPTEFVRAVIAQESGWKPCVRSSKDAVGIMQLMPRTAAALGVRNRCDLKQNISGGVRYLAWLNGRYRGDLRLAAAAYYAGEHAVDRRGLLYSNRDVVAYVASIRARTEWEERIRSTEKRASGRSR
jgi:soluble lytic murein transglycosylase-like protein